ncbi:MAG: TonB-dependent receptor [Caulobacter sp.]|nr:TonB-dependent receptor [Vitreoscilla sp.]
MRKMLQIGVVSLEVIATGSAFGQAAAPTPAASAAAAPAPEEDVAQRVTVTAQKREQTLQDVPLSVSVTNAATIEKAHIVDLIDLQSVVPSLKVAQFNAVGQTNFVIRGFGNGAGNDGIESSVGVFVDGVYRSRTSSALDDLPEIERVEVLRGPQSTLFGKNVSAGAINIVTAKPQFKFGAAASLDVGNLHGLQERATVTGPLSDTVAFRLSGSNNRRDGYLRNGVTGNDVDDRDRQSVRGDLLWNPNADVQARVIVDWNRMRETCCGVVSLQNGPATQFIGGVLGKAVADPTRKFGDDIVFNTDPTNRLSGKGASAQVDWKTSIGTFTSITADRKQTNASTQDVDFTGADLANKNQANDISTFTQELRLASNGSDTLHWMIGGFLQREKLHTGVDTTFGSDMRAYADGLGGQVPAALLGALPPSLAGALSGQSNIYALEFLQGLVTPSIVPGSTYFQAGQGILDHYAMKQDSASLFGNADWNLTDNLTLTGGLAYLTDRKRASSDVTLTDKFSALNLQDVPQFGAIGLPPNLYGPLGALQFFYGDTANHAPVNFPNANESGELEGSKLTKALRANYDFGSWSAYAGWSTGWKAGAYNLSSDSRPPDANGIGRTAGPENVTNFEMGLKTETRKGYFTLAVFDQAIKGFQSNAYTGTGYSLVNAGKESTRGFEMDGAYRPAAWLALTGSATFLDAKYDSFTHAPCVSFDTVRCPVDPDTGLTPAFRDLSGQRPAGIPKWSLSTSATFNQDFGSGLTGFLRAEYDYSSKVQLIDTTPADLSTYGQKNVNASVGLESRPNHWSVTLWARNLFDDRTMVGTFPTVAQAGSYSGFPNAPRLYGVTLGTKF